MVENPVSGLIEKLVGVNCRRLYMSVAYILALGSDLFLGSNVLDLKNNVSVRTQPICLSFEISIITRSTKRTVI